MKRNAKKTVVVIALIALMAIPSMMAYFTDVTETKTNTFTIGNVGITLDEDKWDAETSGKAIVPNQTIEKDPTVAVAKDSNDAYLFLEVKIPVANVLVEGAAEKADTELFTVNQGEDCGWIQVGSKTVADGVATYVYAYGSETEMTTVKAEEEIAPVFESVTFASVVEDELTGEDLTQNIDVTAYGIQANIDNNTVKAPAAVWALVK